MMRDNDNTSDVPLRDYFAAKAMQALLTHLGPYEDDPYRLNREEYNKRSNLAYDVDTLAKYAYVQADAMIQARAKGDKDGN